MNQKIYLKNYLQLKGILDVYMDVILNILEEKVVFEKKMEGYQKNFKMLIFYLLKKNVHNLKVVERKDIYSNK